MGNWIYQMNKGVYLIVYLILCLSQNIDGQTKLLKISRIELFQCSKSESVDTLNINNATIYFVDSTNTYYSLNVIDTNNGWMNFASYRSNVMPRIIWSDTMVLYLGANYLFSIDKITDDSNYIGVIVPVNNSNCVYFIRSVEGYFRIPDKNDSYRLFVRYGDKSRKWEKFWDDKKQLRKAKRIYRKLIKMRSSIYDDFLFLDWNQKIMKLDIQSTK